MLTEFYAVTIWTRPKSVSLYHVTTKEEDGRWQVTIEKIGLRGESRVAVGQKFPQGSPLFIGINLRLRTFANGVKLIHTSPIAALFLDRERANACFSAEEVGTCDPLWLLDTEAVLAAIGEDSEVFKVVKDPDDSLLGR